MKKVFETKIIAIGPEAQNMIADAGMFILFGEGAPADLAEFCFTINDKTLARPIQIGGKLVVDGLEYPITAVGGVVEKNLSNLGHITVALDGSVEGSLPGTLHIQVENPPVLKEGTVIQIFS
ncbi:PTS glucitol/sorbitol transporter subunit IIA [Streptococcus ovis]|uniref:PTS glucitol/sorbitol transporter subunit IIA n=1 Tax=Streptococcus ovis TaxID=82806 RepID=UPI00037136BF|nr:PTS glucitol/sorbitol transporter subunit IIA [Streptococcus ovis]